MLSRGTELMTCGEWVVDVAHRTTHQIQPRIRMIEPLAPHTLLVFQVFACVEPPLSELEPRTQGSIK